MTQKHKMIRLYTILEKQKSFGIDHALTENRLSRLYPLSIP